MKAKQKSESYAKSKSIKDTQNPMLSELNKIQPHTIFGVSSIEPSSAKMREIQQWQGVVEEPSMSESEAPEKQSSDDSYLSQTKEEKLAANLASSEDEYDAPFNKKEFKPSKTMQILEDIIHTREE